MVNTITLDGDGKRRSIEDSDGLRNLIWDLENILMESDGGGDTQVAYTLEPAGYGNLVSQRRAGASKEHHFDAIGSTRELSDSGQAVTDQRDFKAFGSLNASSGATANRFWFIGRPGYWDDPIGYLLLRARWYDPEDGVFLSRDPARQGRNWYRYAGNRPVADTDPEGLAPLGTGCDRCGQDVTVALVATVRKIVTWFAARPTRLQRHLCRCLWNPFTAGGAWDIDDLIPCANAFTGPAFPLHLQCQTGVCESTVAVDGKCHTCGSVNYVALGNMWRECGYSDWTLEEIVRIWTTVFGDKEAKLAWALAGYRQWPIFASAPAPDCPHCLRCTWPKTTTPVFTVKWCGRKF